MPSNRILMCSDPRIFESIPKETTLWRYMTLWRFISLLDKRALFFARADNFTDSLEGTVSPKNSAAYIDELSTSDICAKRQTSLIESYHNAFRKFRQHTYVSCWNENVGESAKMWGLYTGAEGVAVRTTFGRLHKALQESGRQIYWGRVVYVDQEEQPILGTTPVLIGEAHVVGTIAPYYHKSCDFSYEMEVRGVFRDAFIAPDDPSEAEYGIPINASLDELIEAVYVAPRTLAWQLEVAQGLLDKFGIKLKAHPSSFDDPE